ncbi:hypothetical protein OK016_24300 [Vibrio chagasii]|nr:hypothetical protein [Vibrio chagasii]
MKRVVKQGASIEAGNNIAVVKIMQADYLGATDILYDLYLSNRMIKG